MTSKNDDFRKKLYGEYEDSLFRLVMNDAAEKEGKSFLEENEQLKKKSENQPSPEKIERFQHRLDSHMKRRTRHNGKRNVFSILSKVAVIVFVMVAVFSTAMVTVDAFRIRVMNFLIDVQPEYTSFQIKDGSSGSKGEKMVVNWTNTYLPTYIPAGYEVDSLTYTDPLKEITYHNQKNKNLVIDYSESDDSNNVAVDTEKASVKTIHINGHKGMLVVKNSQTTVVWEMDHHIFVICTMENTDETLKIAQNVKFIK
jgi:hypothetical protein